MDSKPQRAQQGKADDAPSDLKQLYRRLARRLHPDVRKQKGAEAELRWEQLQVAYETKDIDKLRALEAICDADETGLSIQLGLAHLNTWADYHQSLLKPLQAAMREAKTHPAWGFSTWTDKKLIRYKKENLGYLKYDLKVIKRARQSWEDQLDAYRDLALKKPRSRPSPFGVSKKTRKKPRPRTSTPASRRAPTPPPQPRQTVQPADQAEFLF